MCYTVRSHEFNVITWKLLSASLSYIPTCLTHVFFFQPKKMYADNFEPLPLPFYDVISVLLKPVELHSSDSPTLKQTKQVGLNLLALQAGYLLITNFSYNSRSYWLLSTSPRFRIELMLHLFHDMNCSWGTFYYHWNRFKSLFSGSSILLNQFRVLKKTTFHSIATHVLMILSFNCRYEIWNVHEIYLISKYQLLLGVTISSNFRM